MSVSETTVLALDAAGGDQGLAVSVPAALAALEQDALLQLILVGDGQEVEAELRRQGVKKQLQSRLLEKAEELFSEEMRVYQGNSCRIGDYTSNGVL